MKYNQRLLTSVSLKFIKDRDLPSCVNCKYFIEYKSPILYPSNELNIINSKCMLFGYKHKVSGEIVHHLASTCRNDITMCDKIGFFYKEKTLKSSNM